MNSRPGIATLSSLSTLAILSALTGALNTGCAGAAPDDDEPVASASLAYTLTFCSPHVLYTTGDFNGAGKTDVIITTDQASFWYLSNGDGTFRVPYTRNDLTLGHVMFTPGEVVA